MHTKEVQQWYNDALRKGAASYERARWFSSPQARAAYAMVKEVLAREVRPRLKKGAAVLELGPGPGTWTRELLSYAPEVAVDAVELSEEMLAQARTALAGREGVRFFCEDFLSFTPTRHYDFFFSSRALEYLPDKKAAVEKVARALAPGGMGCIITKMPHYRRSRLLGRSVPPLHAGQISPSALKALMEEAGLRVVRVVPVTLVFPRLGSARLDRALFALFSRIPLNPLSAPFTESYAVVFAK